MTDKHDDVDRLIADPGFLADLDRAAADHVPGLGKPARFLKNEEAALQVLRHALRHGLPTPSQ
jgi:hypothetical protein